MRHPLPHEIESDDSASPFSWYMHHFAREADAFKKPVEIILPNGATVRKKLIMDMEAAPCMSAPGTPPLAIDHNGMRLWVSLLPDAPGRHDHVICAWYPKAVTRAPAIPDVRDQWMTGKEFLALASRMAFAKDMDTAQISGHLKSTGHFRSKLKNGETIVAQVLPENGLVHLQQFPRRGVLPSARFAAPTFEVMAAGKITSDQDHVFLRIPELDAVGKCLCVVDNRVSALLSGGIVAHTVDFRAIRDLREVTAFERRAVEAWKGYHAMSRAELTGHFAKTDLNDQEAEVAMRALPVFLGDIVDRPDGKQFASGLAHRYALECIYGPGGSDISALPTRSPMVARAKDETDPERFEDLITLLSLTGQQWTTATKLALDPLKRLDIDGIGAPDDAWLHGAFSALSGARGPHEELKKVHSDRAYDGYAFVRNNGFLNVLRLVPKDEEPTMEMCP